MDNLLTSFFIKFHTRLILYKIRCEQWKIELMPDTYSYHSFNAYKLRNKGSSLFIHKYREKELK
jgi:hypothetical protein